jgi:hypothetical protein
MAHPTLQIAQASSIHLEICGQGGQAVIGADGLDLEFLYTEVPFIEPTVLPGGIVANTHADAALLVFPQSTHPATGLPYHVPRTWRISSAFQIWSNDPSSTRGARHPSTGCGGIGSRCFPGLHLESEGESKVVTQNTPSADAAASGVVSAGRLCFRSGVRS